MKDINRLAISVGCLVVGAILAIVGLMDEIPYGNPQPTIELPFLLVIPGLILLSLGAYLAWYEIKISNHANVSNLSTLVNGIVDKISIRLDTHFSELAPDGYSRNAPDMASLFEGRFRHFHEEKEYLADHFTPYLLKRCRYHIETGKKVYLIIDAGTTLYRFFERIGKETVKERSINKSNWLDNLLIETNNLPGVQSLIRAGKLNPSSRYSSLGVHCGLLPGVPLPIYSAVTGKRTNEALRILRDEAGSNAVFIALTTGNWIRLRRSTPVCPVPLARGQGHLEFKQALVDNSDEIFVITPLGKVFVDVSLDEVNRALKFEEENPDPEKKPYQEVVIDDKKASCIKIVSTTRKPHYVLSHHSTTVKSVLDQDEEELEKILNKFPNCSVSQCSDILFSFDKLPEDWQKQIEIEFPHPHTQDKTFTNKFFHVPQTAR